MAPSLSHPKVPPLSFMAQVTAMSITSLVLSFSHFLQLSTPPSPQFQGSLTAQTRLKELKSTLLDICPDCRPLLQCSVTYSRPKALRRRYQDVGQLEVKLPDSEHPLNPTTKFDYCKVDKILNLTEGSCLESFTSFNRLSKSASSPDCSNC